MIQSISVIGLGKLGAPMVACFASKGYRVIGVDMDPAKVDAINRGVAPVYEPRLEEMLQIQKGQLRATQDIAAAVSDSDVTFLVVATPSEPGGGFSLRYVLPACEKIGRALRTKLGFHLVVLTSTVLPGSTGGAVRATLEQASGKLAGVDFGLCYNPEFIALGSVIRDFMNPDFLLVGESDRRSGEILESIYGQVCENQPPVAHLNFVNAEITKLSVNTFVTTKISFANMLARICEKLPEANVDEVTSALGLDSRIGLKYLKGAVSYGGPCFPRDNLALSALARQLGAPADIAQVTDRFNRAQIKWLADLVQNNSPHKGVAGILGLTYKANTDVVEDAAGLLLAQELAARGVSIVVYDPAGHEKACVTLESKVQFATSPRECIEQADTVVLATPWPEFHAIPAETWVRSQSPRTVIDCWRALEKLRYSSGIRYFCLGNGETFSKQNFPATEAQALQRS